MQQTKHHFRAAFAIPALLLLLCCPPAQAETRTTRTYDTLTIKELKHLSALEHKYFEGVSAEAVQMVTAFFDTRTIIQTFSPQVTIIRQRKREELNDITRYLCSLRNDVLDYALDSMLQRSMRLRR